MDFEPNQWLQRLRLFAALLREQGVTNLRQFIAWLRSVEVWPQVTGYLRAHPGLQASIYWVGAFSAGLMSVAYAWIFGHLEEIPRYLSVSMPSVLFVLSPTAFVCSWWLVHRFAPGAAGSGVPQVMAGLEVEAQQASIWVSTRTAVVMVFSSLACTLGGGAIGREGPTLQISASIFYSLGMRFKSIWPSLSHHSLLVAGGSAGIAAAFNTPLGGIVFAVEELSHQHFNRFKTFLISAVIISGLVAQWIMGPYLYLGYPKVAPSSFMTLPWAVVIGLVCGLAGGCFAKVLAFVQAAVAPLTVRSRWKLALLVGFMMALGGCLLGEEVLGSGIGGTSMTSRVLFDDSEQRVSWATMLGRFFGPLISSSAGVTGGIFAPSLSAGAAIGAKMTELVGSPWPNLSVLLGMAAFLSGVTRAPFTAFVLVLEMTDRHSAIFPLMMTSLIASLAAKIIDGKSFYERRCEALLASVKGEESMSRNPGSA